MLLNEALYFLLESNVFLEEAFGGFTIFKYLDVPVEKFQFPFNLRHLFLKIAVLCLKLLVHIF